MPRAYANSRTIRHLRLCQRLRERLAVDVAAGRDDRHRPALDRLFAAQHRRQGDRAAGLDDELEIGEGDGHRLRGFAIAHREGAGEERLSYLAFTTAGKLGLAVPNPSRDMPPKLLPKARKKHDLSSPDCYSCVKIRLGGYGAGYKNMGLATGNLQEMVSRSCLCLLSLGANKPSCNPCAYFSRPRIISNSHRKCSEHFP